MAAGQSWKHGWIPISPVAMRQKNHGRSVKDGSWVTKLAGGSVSAKHMDTAIRGTGRGPQLKMVEAKPSKAPRDLKPGDVVHYNGVPVTVLSHPREGAVRGYKAVYGRRHDTGAHGRVDFLSNDPMDVHGHEKVSAADAKAHTATLKTGLDAKRARLDAIKKDPFSARR